MSAKTAPPAELSCEMAAWLLTKPRPRIVGRTCESPFHHAEGGCRRPVWMAFEFRGDVLCYCSRCWHLHNALYGKYVTMQANPAAAKLGSGLGGLDKTAIDSLTFGEYIDTFPPEWT